MAIITKDTKTITPHHLQAIYEELAASQGQDAFYFNAHTMKCFGDRMSNYKVVRVQIETHWHNNGAYDGNGYQDKTIVIDAWRLDRKRPVKNNAYASNYFTIEGDEIGSDETEVEA